MSHEVVRTRTGQVAMRDAVAGELMHPGVGPLEEAERALDRWHIEEAWRHLNHEQRLLLALHDIEGYSLKEIQALTGFKEGTIKSRLHRARVRLGRLLQRGNVDVAEAVERGID